MWRGDRQESTSDAKEGQHSGDSRGGAVTKEMSTTEFMMGVALLKGEKPHSSASMTDTAQCTETAAHEQASGEGYHGRDGGVTQFYERGRTESLGSLRDRCIAWTKK
jgi:hypothetical protein